MHSTWWQRCTNPKPNDVMKMKYYFYSMSEDGKLEWNHKK